MKRDPEALEINFWLGSRRGVPLGTESTSCQLKVTQMRGPLRLLFSPWFRQCPRSNMKSLNFKECLKRLSYESQSDELKRCIEFCFLVSVVYCRSKHREPSEKIGSNDIRDVVRCIFGSKRCEYHDTWQGALMVTAATHKQEKNETRHMISPKCDKDTPCR